MKKWVWLLMLVPVLALAQDKKAALEAQKKRLQQEIVQINTLIKTLSLIHISEPTRPY